MASDTGDNVGNDLLPFTQQPGVPDELFTDNHQNFSVSGTKWYQIWPDKDIRHMLTDPYSHWQNSAEGSWREILRIYDKNRIHKGVPKRLFPYLSNWRYNTCNVTSLDITNIDGKTPRAWLLWETDYISHLLLHDFYGPFEYILKPVRENPTYLKEDKDQIWKCISLTRNSAEVNT